MENTSIEGLYATSLAAVRRVKTDIHRYLYYQINWDNWLIAIKGARGVGKTTLMLQHIKETFGDSPEQALYVSLDNMWFANHTLSEVVEYHYNHGGTHLFIDEIHRYPHWQTVIKNMADEYPYMHIAYTGSSMLRMDSREGDLSRRQIVYTLHNMSFREFLLFEKGVDLPAVGLSDLLADHVKIAMRVTEGLKILPCFDRYLKYGCYPFYLRDSDGFGARLQSVIRAVLTDDLPAVDEITYATQQKVMRMLMILAECVPQTPKMSELYATLETNREQGMKMLTMLQRAALVQLLTSENKRLHNLSKPDKIYLNNPNLMYALTPRTDTGTLRETFFLNQLANTAEVNYPAHGDFLVDHQYLFEVGGKSKTFEQIKDIPNSYLAVDDIEIGHLDRIPLWMFGLLY